MFKHMLRECYAGVMGLVARPISYVAPIYIVSGTIPRAAPARWATVHLEDEARSLVRREGVSLGPGARAVLAQAARDEFHGSIVSRKNARGAISASAADVIRTTSKMRGL
jgi:hypothetical protein